MSVTEKRAWIILGIVIVLFPVWLILARSGIGPDENERLLRFDRPSVMWTAQLGSVAIALVTFLLRRKKEHGEVTEDERDRTIERRATVAAGYTALITMLVASMAVVHIFKRLRGEQVIPLDVLVAVVVLTCLAWIVTMTGVTLVSYRRER